jgi:hypothetical protein
MGVGLPEYQGFDRMATIPWRLPMPVTKTRLWAMNEEKLQTEILIPLFQAMGFRDVRHYHGGAMEQGKDIVMWWPTPLGDREYHGVVVKATPISGQVNGKGNAGEVFIQLSQALGSTFTDSADLSTRTITKCFVVTPYAIKKEAAESIRNALGHKAHEGTVRLVPGDELWDLLEKHTPEKTVTKHLQFASAVLENASPNYRVTAQLKDGNVHLGVEPKHPLAGEAEPLTFSMQFEFPNSQAGVETREALEAHVKLGTPVSIPAKFIKKFDVPSLLKPFFTEPFAELALGPIESRKTLEASIVLRDPEGHEYRLPGIKFQVVRVGSDEIVLDNRRQDIPWVFSITVNRATRRTNINFQIKATASNVKREVESAHFQEYLSRGGTLTVLNEETGLPLVSVDVPADLAKSPPAAWLRFIDALYLLQQKCHVVAAIPEVISAGDAKDVIELADQLKAGIWEGDITAANLEIKPGALSELLQIIDPYGSNRMVVTREEWLEVFGLKFPLGTVVRVATHMTASEDSRSRIPNADPEQPFHLVLEPANADSKGWIAFLSFLDKSQLTEVKTRLPGMDLSLPLEDNT